MSLSEQSLFNAADTEVLLNDLAFNTKVSTPDNYKKVFNHLATVLVDIF